MKYFTKMKSDCWPCICAIAHKEKWQVKGCWFIWCSLLIYPYYDNIKKINK
jgi:hypothetical protein